MAKKISSKQSTKIDRFVKRLERIKREIATAYVRILNTPDCCPEVLQFYFKYGQSVTVTESIEQLRQELGLDYNTLQSELQNRLIK
jgi:hypothetical protein